VTQWKEMPQVVPVWPGLVLPVVPRQILLRRLLTGVLMKLSQLHLRILEAVLDGVSGFPAFPGVLQQSDDWHQMPACPDGELGPGSRSCRTCCIAGK
jgi:hypothetical protein